jgi:DNA mismatch endonuclease (patch repair protein)
VFTKKRVAIYLDGCFWHGCPEHGSTPYANAGYWIPKLERNRSRDLVVTQRLRETGWTVLRFWEHEPVDSIVKTVVEMVTDDRRTLLVPGTEDRSQRVEFN